MHWLRHLVRLLAELGCFARQHKAWWLLPLVTVMLLLGVLIVAGQTVAPFIYTLF